MKDLNGIGIFVGAIAWIILVWFLAEDLECSRLNNCDSGDMVILAILGLGFLAPAWFVAISASVFLKK